MSVCRRLHPSVAFEPVGACSWYLVWFTCHWRPPYPHPFYLPTLIIPKWQLWEFLGRSSSNIYIYIYIYIQQLARALRFSWLLAVGRANRQSTKKHNTYQLYIYSIPPDGVLQISLKDVEVDWRNKPRINIASSWFLLHRNIEMHGQQHTKFDTNVAYFVGCVSIACVISGPKCKRC
jgi:hypothetical protein